MILDERLKNSVLYELLGTKGIEELRSKLIDTLIDEIRKQLKESPYYVINPDDVNYLMQDIMNEIKKEALVEYKEMVMKNLEKRFLELGI